jgi:biotin---protein ligase
MPVVSLASHQLAGRGRGTNVWQSPRDGSSLAFSLAFRPTGVPEHRFIFIQYLFMLAVVEACRDDRVLGPAVGEQVRIKWPNDLYVVDREGKWKRKVGGVLVNLMSGDNKGLIIGASLPYLRVGCGR